MSLWQIQGCLKALMLLAACGVQLLNIPDLLGCRVIPFVLTMHVCSLFVTGGLCPGSNDPCMEKPCPGDMQCVGYEASWRPFLCQCPPGKLGECSGAEVGCDDESPVLKPFALESMTLPSPYQKTSLPAGNIVLQNGRERTPALRHTRRLWQLQHV